MNHPLRLVTTLLALFVFVLSGWTARTEEFEFRVVDKDLAKPIAARMHLKDAQGKPVKPPNVPYWRDHFVFQDTIRLDLPPGDYTFELERGPEYRSASGRFTIEKGVRGSKEIALSRVIDMSRSGWWSGDLHMHRDPEEIELHLLAEDLHIGPVITWWNNAQVFKGGPPPQTRVKFDQDRFYDLLAGEDEREGGALLYFNLSKPLPLRGAKREHPSPLVFVELARQSPNVHIDIEKPFWWDMPVWIASGQMNSIGVAHNHMHRDGVLANEAWGKPRDVSRYPNPYGNGEWTMDIYFHLLNAGIRIPPSAGSASGVLPNPVGYNRVYVYCGKELSWQNWFENLQAGRVFVTNGPLIRPEVRRTDGQTEQDAALPGHLFQHRGGETVKLDILLDLVTPDDAVLQVIKDREVVHEGTADQWNKTGGKLRAAVEFTKSGWMAVRVIAPSDKTYRFAMTGPYYVQIGSKPRVSKNSAQFFLDWVNERIGRVKLDDAAQQAEVLKYHRQARDFWTKKVAEANAE